MAKKILVVDDEKDIVEIYRKALTMAGYEVVCAYNGEEGLNILRANPNLDLVVLDLKMPKMTGDEVLKFIRKDPILKDTKVLIMSSVLYRYKETEIYDPETGAYCRTRVEQAGLSKIAKRADKFSASEEDKLEMEEKTKARLEFRPFSPVHEPEEEKDFERNVSKDLIKRVKGIFGEPYDEAILKDKHAEGTIIGEKTKDIISKMLKIDREKLHYTSISFKEGLGIDFLDAIPLRKRIEKEFKIKIPWENEQEIKNVSDLIFIIEYLKMQARTRPERMKKADRESWRKTKSYLIALVISFSIWGLIILITQLSKSLGK